MKKNKGGARPNFPNTRKALRKQKRQQKKVHRQEHYLKKKDVQEQNKITSGKFVKRPANPEDNGFEVKKKKPKLSTSVHEIISRQRQKEIKDAGKLKSEMEEQRRKMMLKANEDEDKIIKKLEKQLGLSKSKNKTKNFADDGLDYLLEICDRSTTEKIVAAEKHLANVEDESDFEEDLAAVTGKERDKKLDVSKKKRDENRNSTDKEADSDDELNSEANDDSEGSGSELDDELDDESENEFGDEISEGDSEASDDEGSDVSEDKDEKPTKQKVKHKNNDTLLSKSKENNKQKPKNIVEKVISENELSKVFSDDEISHLSGDDDDDDDLSGDEMDDEQDSKKVEEKPDVWEDIYGRKRDKEGNVIKEEKGTYIPPHLRNKDSTSDAQLAQLERQVKSVLNKLSGSNLHWACTTLEQTLVSYSGHAACEAVWTQWQRACGSSELATQRSQAEHAALIATQHANSSGDIGAYFLQQLVTKFDELVIQKPAVEDKTLDNIVCCLSNLYNFKLFHANLLYDILSRLLEDITEKNIDCVLVILRTVGGVLRKEEPLALKNFIHETQAKLAKLNEGASSGSRIKFLLEVLLAVKNNNLTKIPNYDPTYGEDLKKIIKGIIRKGNYITPLNIRLEDLLKADERGKWWVVGSAWTGNLNKQDKPTDKPMPNADQKLLELARKQRMNTDVRRSIFCVIMSAQDYMDAFEKLQHLGLKGQQEREIVHVLLACCLQEKNYNPYYAVLGQKLCEHDRKYQLSIQYSIWDKIKDIENQSKLHLSNLAQFLIHLLMEKSLPLSVLKIIQFSDLNKSSVKFMRQILLAIIMNADLESSLEVFTRISRSPKLHLFRESLRLFIQHFLIKNAGKKTSVLNEQEMATLRERTLQVDKILTMHESKLML